MKKFYSILAIAAMVAVACSKDDKGGDEPEPQPQPQPAEYTGPEQGDSEWSVIGALSELPENADWGTDWVMKKEGDIFYLKNVKLAAGNEFKVRFQKDWGTNRGGAFAELGKGFDVVQNGDNVKPGLDGFYDVYYNAAVEQMAVCAKGTIPTWAEPAPAAAITIDGDFSDWLALDPTKIADTYGDEDATHPVLLAAYVYADPNYIFVAFEYDAEAISHEPDVEHVPFHCYINTDGDATTGGFSDQFSDACTDVLLEGFIYPEGSEIGSYDPDAFSWSGEVNGGGWEWAGLEYEGSICEGAGVEGKYEFLIKRDALKAIGFPVADVFSIGFDIQQGWNSVGILPNEAPSEENPSGLGESLEVVTTK